MLEVKKRMPSERQALILEHCTHVLKQYTEYCNGPKAGDSTKQLTIEAICNITTDPFMLSILVELMGNIADLHMKVNMLRKMFNDITSSLNDLASVGNDMPEPDMTRKN